ncbi:MAG TPA: FISUMP domain-containing protein [Bacteroidales bacterium]|nr:FISUMP domain-containing protein [Bacteroidales bacterium]
MSVSDISGQGPVYTLTDPRDSKVYTIVKIKDYWWMAENLDAGEMIPSESEMTENSTIEKYCLYNDPAYCDTFGGLYQWNELMQYTMEESAQGICPDGWHIPSDGDWKRLEGDLGMSHSDIESYGLRGTTEGGKLKAVGTEFWLEPNTGATNEVGFSLLPAGGRGSDSTTCCEGYWTDFWTSTQDAVDPELYAWYRQFFHDNSQINRTLGHKPYGTSVRCIKNNSALFEMNTITDERDGQVYNIVRIDEQWWMAQNLNVGVMINHDDTSSQNAQIEKYCQDDLEKNCGTHGGLYLWDEMMSYNPSDSSNPGKVRGICPSGWHLPTEAEWDQMDTFIAESGNLGMEGTVMKSTHGWNNDGNGTDIYGFAGLPSGKLNPPPGGGFYTTGYYGFYWTATESNASFARSRYLQYMSPAIYHTGDEKGNGYSVRCVMDTYLPMRTVLLAPDTVCASQEFNIIADVGGGTGAYAFSWISDPPGTYPENDTITVSPAANTKYYLMVDDGESLAKDSILIIVNPLPVLDLTGPTKLCASEESVFYSTANNINYLYSWSAVNGQITTAANLNQVGVKWGTITGTKTLNLVVTDKGTGCYTEKQISVEVFSVPAINIIGPEIVCAGEKINAYTTPNNADYQFAWSTDNGQITTSANIDQIVVDWGTVPGTKTLNLVVTSKTTGCYAEKQISVEALPMPLFDITGPTELCAGEESKIYSAVNDPSFNYDWYTENGVITTPANVNQVGVNWESIPGTKTLDLEVVDSPNGCHAHKQISVEVKPSPEKPQIIQKGSSILICIDSGMVYQWYRDGIPINGETKQFYYARDNDGRVGAISVETSLDNGCKNSSESHAFSAKSSAFNEVSEQNRVFVHPNPNNGLITIEIFDEYAGLVDIQIINGMGQVVRQVQLAKPSEILERELDLKPLESGMYFLIFKFANNREIQRIYINRTD